VPKIAAGLYPRILPEGTPVSLISVEDWSSKTAENGELIAFMLAGDVQVDGVTVAPIGSKAWGQASFGGDGKAMQLVRSFSSPIYPISGKSRLAGSYPRISPEEKTDPSNPYILRL
jgi:hypothetical protein